MGVEQSEKLFKNAIRYAVVAGKISLAAVMRVFCVEDNEAAKVITRLNLDKVIKANISPLDNKDEFTVDLKLDGLIAKYNQKIKIGVVSLGCDKNRVDSENMIAYLEDFGYEITNDTSEANILIVNTCGFIEAAKTESVDTILELAQYKDSQCGMLIATGCFSQRYMSEVAAEMPEVDILIGTASYHKLPQMIADLIHCRQAKCSINSIKETLDNSYQTTVVSEKFKEERLSQVKKTNQILLPNAINERVFTTKRVLTTPYHYAYLKIAEGCDNKCTYCAIPKIRGKYTSRPIESLEEEAKFLVGEYGIAELNIVAQDITRYGIDIYNEYSLLKLLDKLTAIEIPWIRLLYCYPELLSKEIIKYISQSPKICKYVDIPLQHINDSILKLMNRRTGKSQIEKLVEDIRKENENIAIRSTFIVGFPGEGESEFSELIEFIKKYKLDRAGFFAYSDEDNTAATKLGGKLSQEVKEARQREIYRIQNEIMAKKLLDNIGKTKSVIYEGIDYDRQMFFGRTEQDAPEIDSKIYFKSKKPLDIGRIYSVKVTKTDDIDLIGELK